MNIAIIEDDPDLLDTLCMILNAEGFSADGIRSIAGFNVWSQTHDFDLVILDRMLPDGDGLSLVQSIKSKHKTPIIMLTGKADTHSRVQGFDADVDYYLPKPMTSQELLAIVKRCQRHLQPHTSVQWSLNKVNWLFTNQQGISMKLTNNEFLFLSCFVDKAGMVINRDDLAVGLGHDPALYDFRRMDVLIKRLRDKIAKHTSSQPLQSIYGAGYTFNEPIVWHK